MCRCMDTLVVRVTLLTASWQTHGAIDMLVYTKVLGRMGLVLIPLLNATARASAGAVVEGSR